MEGSDDTGIQLSDLLNRIRTAHESGRLDLIPPLIREFIEVAGRRLLQLAHRVIRKQAPDFAGQTDALLSEAFKRLHDSLAEHLPPANPEEYFRLASTQIRFALRDLIRRKQQERDRSVESIPSDVPGDSTGPAEKVGRAEFWERFFVVLEGMPDRLRYYFDLHWTQGFSHDECAKRLGMTLKKARMRWEEIKLWLRKRLGDFPDDL